MTETMGYLPREGGERLAYRRSSGHEPTVLWLGGFRSDMSGTKAQTLADWAQKRGQAFVRFDYFAHGASSGDFSQGGITRWREDALAVVDEMTQGPLILVGSSMGGWLACLAAAARPERTAGLVLIAPAADFTETLLKPNLPPQAIKALAEHGLWIAPGDFGEGGYPITRTLLEDGARWSILPGPVPIRCPVRILQGGRDAAVPWTHALALAQAIEGQDMVYTLIRDGDHRLSRPQDLDRLIAALQELVP
jgi:alpha-beta hydrolase superfamily lysophospholipase